MTIMNLYIMNLYKNYKKYLYIIFKTNILKT